MDWTLLELDMVDKLGRGFRLLQRSPLLGGDTSQTWRLRCADAECFLKLERAARASMLQCEAAGLQAIAQTNTLRTPTVLHLGSVAGFSYLLLEYLELDSLQPASAAALGTGLATMHRAVLSQDYGGSADNYIGGSPQPNTASADWTAFFARQRLGYQARLADARGASHHLLDAVDAVIDALPTLLRAHRPQPSLLHGDLWIGNAAALADGTPVVFDPAVYFGDREADVAMTEFFGRFPADFYAAYEAAWPLDNGYALRRDLYNLYHALNHFTLFGDSYGAQSLDLARGLLAAIR